MATFAFIHGAGDVGWYWHLVEAELRRLGHDTVAPDLPVEDDTAGLAEYATAVVDAIRDRRDVVVVAQSFGGYVAPIVAERVGARLIVLVAGMIPSPGESAEEMFATTRWAPERLEDSSERAVFYHDVPRGARRRGAQPGPAAIGHARPGTLAARGVAGHQDPVRPRPERPVLPGPLDAAVVRDRLGIEPEEIDSGHCPALSRPLELAGLLDGYATETAEHP